MPSGVQMARPLPSTRDAREASGVYLKDLGGQEHLVLRNDLVRLAPESFSPDGAVLAYTHQGVSQTSIWLLTLGEKPVARPLTSATASEYSPKFSPDGRWLAYVVDQLERSEVYIRGYPAGEPIPVSSSGGAGPVWSRDGRTLFYESAQSGGRTLMSVPVSVDGDTLKLGAPSRAVSLALAGGDEYGRSAYWGPEYDVFPDGDFVMLRGPGPGSARGDRSRAALVRGSQAHGAGALAERPISVRLEREAKRHAALNHRTSRLESLHACRSTPGQSDSPADPPQTAIFY